MPQTPETFAQPMLISRVPRELKNEVLKQTLVRTNIKEEIDQCHDNFTMSMVVYLALIMEHV